MDLAFWLGMPLLIYCLFNRKKIDASPMKRRVISILIYCICIGVPLFVILRSIL